MPHEFILGEIYLPPLLVVCAMAYISMLVVMQILSRLDWLKYFAMPALLEVSLVVIFASAISKLIAI
ncbi:MULTISPECIES: DUF1656 domain-containing protein [Shewanella]|uniref:DUF1656 domain-containing protein n=1 Tax=Shewanella TaxID=22 RepID=UPI00048C9605|nr:MULTISPECIES: DUF1656 domain-containing protein [Shewanella]QLE84523.1 DUF1656 domain-containing protein [Shewanella sp. Scap07]